MVNSKSKTQWFDSIFNITTPSPLIAESSCIPPKGLPAIVSSHCLVPQPLQAANALTTCMGLSHTPHTQSQARWCLLCWLLSLETRLQATLQHVSKRHSFLKWVNDIDGLLDPIHVGGYKFCLKYF